MKCVLFRFSLLLFFATSLPLATHAEEPKAPEKTSDDCRPLGDMQVCWGSTTLTKDPKAPHTAAFSFKFAKPFGSIPVVTQAVNVNGGGHAMAVYSWQLDTMKYSGRLNNMYIGTPVGGVITMSYMAIGKPAAPR